MPDEQEGNQCTKRDNGSLHDGASRLLLHFADPFKGGSDGARENDHLM
jgi:hypothetical protein